MHFLCSSCNREIIQPDDYLQKRFAEYKINTPNNALAINTR